MDVTIGKVNRRWKNVERMTIADVMEIQMMIQSPDYNDDDIRAWLISRDYNPEQVLEHFRWVQREWAKMTPEERRAKIRKQMNEHLSEQEKQRLKKLGIELPFGVSYDPQHPTVLDIEIPED